MADPGAGATRKHRALRHPQLRRAGAREALIEFLVVLAVLAVVVVIVGWPLRAHRIAARAGGASEAEPQAQPELADLEAARDAKYREIRDAELDHRTGKLSDADFDAIDQALRAEAVEILDQLDRYHRGTR